MSITRWSRILVLVLVATAAAVLLAAPPTPPQTTTGATTPKVANPKPHVPVVAPRPVLRVTPDHPGVHINSVKIMGNCHQAATYQVEIQNNLTKIAHKGMVVIKAANGGTHSLNFDNLNPNEKRTLTIATPWNLTCDLSEVGQPSCFEVSVSMEPDGTANGEVFDGVYHTVCAGPPNPPSSPTPAVTDSQHK